jgi:hypothetical protein
MIAVLFKNRRAEPQIDHLFLQSQAALQERMLHMLRQDARIAWATPRAHLPFPGAVKKPIAIRSAIAAAI